MEDQSQKLRTFFASLVASKTRVRDPAIEQAFAHVKRETFAGAGPWSIMLPGRGYVKTPDSDPAFIYQDTLVALDPSRGLNIGMTCPYRIPHPRWREGWDRIG